MYTTNNNVQNDYYFKRNIHHNLVLVCWDVLVCLLVWLTVF